MHASIPFNAVAVFFYGGPERFLSNGVRVAMMPGGNPDLINKNPASSEELRVCPKTSGGITKFSEHEAD